MTSTDYQQLVEFLGRQFSEIDRRFVGIDQRFLEIDRRFVGIDQRFDEMGGQLAELRRDVLGHFDEIYRRFERLDQEYHAITQALRRIEAVLADERGRREILERDLAQLKKGVAALQARIDEIEQRLGR
jgi:predicted  nucleic acid-binding Zn-ribbon protein